MLPMANIIPLAILSTPLPNTNPMIAPIMSIQAWTQIDILPNPSDPNKYILKPDRNVYTNAIGVPTNIVFLSTFIADYISLLGLIERETTMMSLLISRIHEVRDFYVKSPASSCAIKLRLLMYELPGTV
jgi:hypothetical protein